MKLIALLRGINISGKNKIPMKLLKEEFLNLGYKNVLTYLNSGNVIFEVDNSDTIEITTNIKNMIKNKFNLDIPIVVIDSDRLKQIVLNSPSWWGINDGIYYHNIIFIIPPTSINEVVNKPTKNKDLELVECSHDVIYWSYKPESYRKSLWWNKTANSSISNSITIRTSNTIKKLDILCDVDYENKKVKESVTYSYVENDLIEYRSESKLDDASVYEFVYKYYFGIGFKTKNSGNVEKMTEELDKAMDNLERLKHVEKKTIDKSDLFLIELYRMFYGKSPDFTDENINKLMQTMLSIMMVFNITFDDYHFNYNSDLEKAESIKLKEQVYELYPVADTSQVENDSLIKSDIASKICIIGSIIRENITDIDELKDFSSYLYNCKYRMDKDSIDHKYLSLVRTINSRILH